MHTSTPLHYNPHLTHRFSFVSFFSSQLPPSLIFSLSRHNDSVTLVFSLQCYANRRSTHTYTLVNTGESWSDLESNDKSTPVHPQQQTVCVTRSELRSGVRWCFDFFCTLCAGGVTQPSQTAAVHTASML